MSILGRIIDKRLEAYQNQIAGIHYSEVEKMYLQMRGWNHDYRNHIQIMKSLLNEGDIRSHKKYLENLEEDLLAIDIGIKTGNAMTDVILSSKVSLARSKGIKVTVEAEVPVKLYIGEIDLCIVVGNLMDNAIEACEKVHASQRFIRIYMEMKGTQLYFSITNTTADKKQIKKNNRFRTKKGYGHGIGLIRIDTIVDRYCGYINRNSEEGAFTTEILLPQENIHH